VAPVEKVLEGHVSTPVLSALTFVPAAFVEQNAAPGESENSPGPSQEKQTEPSPLLPETHISHVVGEFPTVLWNSPGEHVIQDEAPWLLKLGLRQSVQSSEAPVENVLEGHTSTPVLSALTFVPAAFVEQNAAPAEEKLPAEVQLSQAANEAAPLSLNVPAGQTTSAVPFE